MFYLAVFSEELGLNDLTCHYQNLATGSFMSLCQGSLTWAESSLKGKDGQENLLLKM